MAEKTMVVEVAYALPHKQKIVTLNVPEGTSMLDAVRLSCMDQHFPELDLESAPLGIFGKAVPKPAERVLQSGERVEIYRPLIADPKEVRKQRAAKAKAAKTED
ncbi:RnfH family protein [Halopseudomonas aestusnigri]|uniref:UPF0125 protein SAMN05216586_10961 n=1 Tax=Halopseudomonas aestusnigri TaxID=857252 RepID=A0AAQ1G8C7_9GAMM|nr:RnfH family protein [Halopseudomonas aestusnigri]OWL86525.1 RnfH family protein [Halopseudomonas aestusnigri]SEG54235.1 hypothetical protein SAMN05216586_10961 [Halopseudomonas aestusnigri]